MKSLFVGVVVSLLSLSAVADDIPNGILCGEYEHATGQGDPGVTQIQPITNGFILTGTGVVHGGNSYTAVNPDASDLKGVVRAYYQASRHRMLFISDDGKGMATVTVGNPSDLDVKDIYTSCTYLYQPAKVNEPQPLYDTSIEQGRVVKTTFRF
jgi:hypothetical protein